MMKRLKNILIVALGLLLLASPVLASESIGIMSEKYEDGVLDENSLESQKEGKDAQHSLDSDKKDGKDGFNAINANSIRLVYIGILFHLVDNRLRLATPHDPPLYILFCNLRLCALQ